MTAARDLPIGQVLLGDASERLGALPPSSVDVVITSPPYFGLRNYGHARQLGLEADLCAWVEAVRSVCHKLVRILRPSGSLWLNVGDSYSGHVREGAPPKSLLLGPQRLILALADDGWIVRNQVIWAKTNGIPSSVGDRLSANYEVLLFLVRAPRYYFDLDMVRIPFFGRRSPQGGVMDYRYLPDDAVLKEAPKDRGLNRLKLEGRNGNPLGKNPGDVWRLPTARFRGAHFATFPPELVEIPLLATCPEKVCIGCGRPWNRQAPTCDGELPRRGQVRPACGCTAGTTPGVVLDPFMGSGTVAVVAELHRRNWVGIELNPTYVALAQQRVVQERARRRGADAA